MAKCLIITALRFLIITTCSVVGNTKKESNGAKSSFQKGGWSDFKVYGIVQSIWVMEYPRGFSRCSNIYNIYFMIKQF